MLLAEIQHGRPALRARDTTPCSQGPLHSHKHVAGRRRRQAGDIARALPHNRKTLSASSCGGCTGGRDRDLAGLLVLWPVGALGGALKAAAVAAAAGLQLLVGAAHGLAKPGGRRRAGAEGVQLRARGLWMRDARDTARRCKQSGAGRPADCAAGELEGAQGPVLWPPAAPVSATPRRWGCALCPLCAAAAPAERQQALRLLVVWLPPHAPPVDRDLVLWVAAEDGVPAPGPLRLRAWRRRAAAAAAVVDVAAAAAAGAPAAAAWGLLVVRLRQPWPACLWGLRERPWSAEAVQQAAGAAASSGAARARRCARCRQAAALQASSDRSALQGPHGDCQLCCGAASGFKPARSVQGRL